MNTETTKAASLATGSPLTAETWSNFVSRLHHDCIGAGVERHYTTDAIFIVQARRLIFGIDKAYTDSWAVLLDGHHWFSPQEYWNDCDEEERARLNRLATEGGECGFLEMREAEQWDLLDSLDDHTVTGWDYRWDYVCAHLTRDAADAFIARKKHDYRDGIRVYVDAQVYCWEFNAIKEAILTGRLQFVAESHPEAA